MPCRDHDERFHCSDFDPCTTKLLAKSRRTPTFSTEATAQQHSRIYKPHSLALSITIHVWGYFNVITCFDNLLLCMLILSETAVHKQPRSHSCLHLLLFLLLFEFLEPPNSKGRDLSSLLSLPYRFLTLTHEQNKINPIKNVINDTVKNPHALHHD